MEREPLGPVGRPHRPILPGGRRGYVIRIFVGGEVGGIEVLTAHDERQELKL